MATITINTPDDAREAADYVEQVLEQIRGGCTSGHWDAESNWESEGLRDDD